MGLAICKKHGESGVISGITLDLCQDLENYPASINNIVTVYVEVFDGDEYLYTQKNYVSEQLFLAQNLVRNYRITNDEQENSLNEIFPKTSGVCGKCFENYILKNGITVEK